MGTAAWGMTTLVRSRPGLVPLPLRLLMSPTAPASSRAWLTANLLLQLAYGLLAMTICLPSLPGWAQEFGATQSHVQLSFSAFVAAYGGLQLIYGPVSDRLGRKPVLLFGLALAGLGSLLGAYAPSLWVLTVARVLQGAGCAAGMVTGRAMVQDLFSGPERTRVMAFIGMTMGLCPPLATLLGGQVHERLGWQLNFAFMAGLAVLAFIAAWRGLPARRPQAPAGQHWLRALLQSYAQLAREPAFLLYVVLLAMTTATFYCFLAGAPIVLAGYGVGPGQVGWYIMAIPFPYVLGNLLASRLVSRWGDRKIMTLGQSAIFFGLGLLLALAWGGWRTPLAFALPLIFLGIGHGLLTPLALAGTVGLLPALAGAAAAVAGTAQQFTGAFGGYLVGLLTHDGPVHLALLMLALTTLGWLAYLLLYRVVLRRR
jgi:DHA1 family bicyclomycin/chloramphenicol resistance-like MFS transporter